MGCGCGKSGELGRLRHVHTLSLLRKSPKWVPMGPARPPECTFQMHFQVIRSYPKNWDRILSLHAKPLNRELINTVELAGSVNTAVQPRAGSSRMPPSHALLLTTELTHGKIQSLPSYRGSLQRCCCWGRT